MPVSAGLYVDGPEPDGDHTEVTVQRQALSRATQLSLQRRRRAAAVGQVSQERLP